MLRPHTEQEDNISNVGVSINCLTQLTGSSKIASALIGRSVDMHVSRGAGGRGRGVGGEGMGGGGVERMLLHKNDG